MQKIIVFLFVVAALAVGTASAGEVGRYLATDSDKTASALVSRWASLEGRTVQWEAQEVFPLHYASYLNRDAHLSSATSLADAFSLLTKSLNHAKPKALPLRACLYEDKLVVRTADQPECGKPLN